MAKKKARKVRKGAKKVARKARKAVKKLGKAKSGSASISWNFSLGGGKKKKR
jgi:hypothetical protein